MLRKEFIRNIFLGSVLSNSLFDSLGNVSLCRSFEYPIEELTGITKPTLYGSGFELRLEAANALMEMMQNAYLDGVSIWCSSSYRGFYAQKEIWNTKFTKYLKELKSEEKAFEEVIKYSALPGTSRHHWGTDIDVIDALGYQNQSPLTPQNFETLGEYQYLHHWMKKNAEKYGFVEVYTNDRNRTGFLYEPWHYTYAPLSKAILNQVLNYDFTTFEGFKLCKGNKFLTKQFIEKYYKTYLLGINPVLIPH